jgi:hypothetical protein
VTIETVYDRSELIERAIDTLKATLIEEASSSRWCASSSCCTCAARWSRSSCCRSAC